MTRAIAKGAIWMVLFKLGERSLGLLSVLILARLLVPADFGLVAMAMSVIALIELASAFNFEIALIQREQPTREHYDTAWTLNLLLGMGCAMLTAVCAYPTALFYSEPKLMPVMLMLALAWIIQSFENIGTVDFRRNMAFSREFLFLGGKKLVGFVVTIPLALLLQSYWALVAGIVAGRIAGVFLSYSMQPFRPRLSLVARRDLFSFSGWLLVNNAIGFGTARLSHFIIGRAYGSSTLGLYTLGAEIAMLPATEFVAAINRAVFPGYSRMAGNVAGLRRGFIDVFAVTAVFALPACFGIAAIADPLIRALLGEAWRDAIPVAQILAFCGLIHALMSNSYSAYLALGRTSLLVLLNGLRLAALIPLLVIASSSGAVGVAYAELGAALVMFVASHIALLRVLKVSMWVYAANSWRPLLAAASMAVIIAVVLGDLANNTQPTDPVLQLLIALPLGLVIYPIALTLLWLCSGRVPGAESIIIAWLSEVVAVRLAIRNRSH